MVWARQWFIVMGLVFGLVLVGCAAPQQPAPAPSPERPAVAAPAAPTAELTREQKLVEGAKKEGEVALWVTTIDERENMIRLFQARYPFLTLRIWDGSTAEILARLAEEAKAGRHTVDVLMGSSSSVLPDSRKMGLLVEYDFPNTVGWTDQPTHKYYQTPFATARVVDYNTDLVSPAEVPRSWDDVKSTRWAGKTMVATAADHPVLWAYLWKEKDKLNWDKSFAFWGDVVRNTRPIITRSYTDGVARLAAGEVALFPTVPSTSTMRFIVKGAPVAIAPLGKAPGSKVGIALVKDAPHPNAARLLIDWMTAPEGLLAYADPTLMLVTAPELRGKARANRFLGSLGVSYDLIPDELLTPENVNKSVEFWQKALGLRG